MYLRRPWSRPREDAIKAHLKGALPSLEPKRQTQRFPALTQRQRKPHKCLTTLVSNCPLPGVRSICRERIRFFKPHFYMKAIFQPFLLLLSVSSLQAFPPAPYYSLYGTVRDQVGQAITAESAEIILLKDDAEIGRTPINSTFWLDQNRSNVR